MSQLSVVDVVKQSVRCDCRQGLLADTASYAMSRVHRGKFVIISNKNFAGTTLLSSRRSADHDVDMLRDAFSQLGFDVIIHCDKTAQQMLAIITEGICFLLFCISRMFKVYK